MSDEPLCLDCLLTDSVWELLENGAPVAHVWEIVKDAIEMFQDGSVTSNPWNGVDDDRR